MALVQCVANDNAGGATTLVANISATTAGSLVVACFMYKSSAASISSVQDSASNSYTSALTPVAGGNYSAAMYYFPNVGAGVTSVTATFNSSNPGIIFVAEESGMATSSPVDGTPGGFVIGTGGTYWTSRNTVTTNNSDVLYGFSVSTQGINQSYAAITPWVAVTGTGITVPGHRNNATDADDAFMERQVVTLAGAYQAEGTCALNTGVRSIVAAFQQIVPPSPIAWNV